jgi:hypothetical protein
VYATRRLAMDNEHSDGFKPPWLAFKTFLGFLQDLGEKPLPPKIDRSMMGSKSGNDQAQLLSALKGFGFIDQEQNVLSLLTEFTGGTETDRKALLRRLVREHYPEQIAVSEQNGTEALLRKSFSEVFGLQGDTHRKAVTFFLQAARWTGITLSPHFPITRMGSGPRAGATRKRTAKRTGTGRGKQKPSATAAEGKEETKTIELGDAGFVTLTVDVRWLELPDETFTALREAIRTLEALGVEPEPEDEDAGDEPDAVEVDSS